MSDKLQGLEADFREQVETLLGECRKAHVSMVSYFTVRTPHEQARLWRQSRPWSEISARIEKLKDAGAPFLASVLESVGPQNGPHVTNALPGASWHQWGEAVDCYWEVDGKAEWSTTRKVNGQNGYRVYAATAKDQGLTAGGYWSSLKDWPHVQKSAKSSPLSAGMSWAQIDQAMQERFAISSDVLAFSSMDAVGSLFANERPKVGYRSPHGWKTFYTENVDAVLYRARMTICADGAAKAYHENNAKALDYLGNAGRPGNWWAIVTDDGTRSGTPVKQGKDDPAPGYYVSTTAMVDPTHERADPRRYVDATQIPYVVLPGSGIYRKLHPTSQPRLGDLAIAYNTENGLLTPAIFAELGPTNELGEASIELARRLKINHDAKRGGTHRRIIKYMVFAGTGTGRVLTIDEIERQALHHFEKWGGINRLDEYEL